jgi:tocopherol O-methyltransferase
MHHGYYIPENRTDHQQAQIDLIDEVLKWAGATSAKRVVDVGCGIGGSSRHISRKFEADTQGITLSPYQAARGNELAIEQGLQDKCNFQVADALEMPFQDESFDLVWSLESGEHMPDKSQFVNELFRVCEPNGRIIIVTWCHRDLKEGETTLAKWEDRLLRKINRAYYLPEWCSVQDYVTLLNANGATDVKRDDWSYIIAPFWKAVIKSSLNVKSIVGLARSGFSTQRGAYAMFLMLRGFNKGVIKFGCLTCTKPVKNKVSGFIQEKPAVQIEPDLQKEPAVDLSIPYDAAARLAYKTLGEGMRYADFKVKYEKDAVADVIAKQKKK